tara:strand:- start:306 stop:1631 length:1326 start_codon:yes stop_codon:yes gene_type:complete
MNRLLFIILLFILNHCSFDNKTGIWKNSSIIDIEKKKRFEDFKTLYTEEKTFNSIIEPPENLNLLIDPIKTTNKWPDEFYRNSNNLDNFSYKDLNNLIFKSKKLSKHKISKKILFDGENIIVSDIKGNIIVYSLEKKQTIYKYNFYKKKFKKIIKNINITISNNIIFAVDNLGYLYALNYKTDKLIWAKNYQVPFRSNLKLIGDKIVAADQDNSLYLINRFNGERLRTIPTEETILKNYFVNSIASDENSLFYLNTYGSIYSISNTNLKINWFVNLNRSLDLNPSSLFFSNPIVIYKDKIIVSTDPYLYVLDSISGSTIFKTPIISIFKPIISGNKLFIITKDNLLVCIDLIKGNIIYSLNISDEIGNFLETKSKQINIKSLSLVNNNLLIFLNNSYLVQMGVSGKIMKINKLPTKLNTFPIFVKESILFLNNKNKLVIIN